jgi:hypothetical protein
MPVFRARVTQRNTSALSPMTVIEQAEQLYHVHGKAGKDPTEPARSGEFPYPAVSYEPRIQKVHDDLVRTGHKPFHLPARS